MPWPKGKPRKERVCETSQPHQTDRLSEASERAAVQVDRPSYIGTNMRYVPPKREKFQGYAIGHRQEPKHALPIVQPNPV